MFAILLAMSVTLPPSPGSPIKVDVERVVWNRIHVESRPDLIRFEQVLLYKWVKGYGWRVASWKRCPAEGVEISRKGRYTIFKFRDHGEVFILRTNSYEEVHSFSDLEIMDRRKPRMFRAKPYNLRR